MNCGHIGRCSPSGPQFERAAPRASGRAEIKTRTESSALTLKVRTDEGDVVEISLAAQSQRTSARATWSEDGRRTKVNEHSSSSSFSAQIKVDGNLSEQEVADIQNLLSSLSSGGDAADPAETSVAAFDYSYSRARQVTSASVSVLA